MKCFKVFPRGKLLEIRACVLGCSDVTMLLCLIRYDYDTIITKNRDCRYDFDYSSKPVIIDTA